MIGSRRSHGAGYIGRAVRPKTLDHVAYWLADRDRVADFVTTHLGMHVIERTDKFTLVGSDARKGKLTLFEAEAPRERGALGTSRSAKRPGHGAQRAAGQRGRGADERLSALRSRRRREPRARRGADRDRVRPRPRRALLADPEATAQRYRDYGFEAAEPGADGAPRVEVAGAYVEFHEGEPGDPEAPLLNHLAVLVDSAEDHRKAAEELDIEVQDFVDAPNTLAVFVWLPERVRLEYVEHKPTFALQ